MAAVEVKALTKTFPGGVEAVRGIDLVVDDGEIFGFLGPNGAGKTTTVRMLTTLLKPTSGLARVAGFDVVAESLQVRFSIGVALQDAGLDRMATGRETLVMQARLHGIHGQPAADRAAELLEIVGLVYAADRRVGTYSGGMKRRLDLASALVQRPRVLFLDEPTAGLDPASRQAIWDEVTRINKDEGVTVFLTTQYLEEADRLAQRVAIIDHGTIVAEGTPATLKASIGNEVVTVSVARDSVDAAVAKMGRIAGDADVQVEDNTITMFLADGSQAMAKVVRTLDRAKIAVESITVARPTLDEVFLHLTGSRLEGADEADAGEAS